MSYSEREIEKMKVSKKYGIPYSGEKLLQGNNQKKELIIPDQYRLTSDMATQFELTKIIANRAKQIEEGGPIFIDSGNESDPRKIAFAEIIQKKSPCIIIRRDNEEYMKEIWKINEMTLPFQ
jgi:DNA-directed RNA polymerase subunit K/omega